MCSSWRNDAERDLLERAWHLVDKTYPNMRWVWVVGDSDDETFAILDDFAEEIHYHRGLNITVIEHETEHKGSDHRARLARLSESCSMALAEIKATDDYMVMHESDLISPDDLIEQFLATGKDYVAGATWLHAGETRLFYDVWGFWRDGVRFCNDPPYHACWKDDELFQVDSFGSCWMVKAAPFVDGLRCYTDAAREMSGKLVRDYDAELWCAPWIEIIQPMELWEPWQLSSTEMAREEWKQ